MLIEHPKHLGLEDVDLIFRTLIAYGDFVWLRSGFEWDPRLQKQICRQLSHRLHDLRSAGRIKLWALESSLGRSFDADRLIVVDEELELGHVIIGRVQREASSVISGMGGVELTSKMIDYQHGLWTLGVAGLCGTEGIAHGNESFLGSLLARVGDPATNRDRYVRTLFEVFGIADLWRLTAEQVLDFQKRAAPLRLKVEGLMDDWLFNPSPPDDEVRRRCEVIQEEYHEALGDIMMRLAPSHVVKRAFRDSAVAVSGVFLPVLSALPIGDQLIGWFKDRNMNGFLLYMQRLKTTVERQRERD